MNTSLPQNRVILVDWSEKHPQESARDIAVRQSTIYPCGKRKEIGVMSCSFCPR